MVDLPQDLAHDLRQACAGDSFNWAGVEPTAAKRSFVVHATASQSEVEDGMVVADYHVNHNGWSGAGVHFVITKDSYPGDPRYNLPPGAQIHYIGDLGTWRAGCVNQNPGRVHMEISGLFTPGNGVPSENQLRLARKLIDFLLAPNEILPSFNYYSQVTYHNAVPEQQTECPGWQNPQFSEWFSYLQGGPEPSWFLVNPAPEPQLQPNPTPPPAEVIVPEPQVPDYEQSWNPYVVPETKTVTEPDAYAVDATGSGAPILVPVGHTVDIAGEFTSNGKLYFRTVYSRDHNTWYGVAFDKFTSPGQVTNATIPVAVTPVVADVAPPVTSVPSAMTLSKLLALLLMPLLKLIGLLRKG